MGFQDRHKKRIDELTPEELFEEITQFLKTRRSGHFKFDPRQAREEAILRVFESSQDESFRNRMRQAIYLFFQKEKEAIFQFGGEFSLRIFELVDEMRVSQAYKFLADVAKTETFGGLPKSDCIKIKTQVLATLVKSVISEEDVDSGISEKELRDVINHNISDINYTEVCLIGSLKLTPKIDSFVGYLPIGLRKYEQSRDRVRLPTVFRTFLTDIGPRRWCERAQDIVFCDDSKLATFMRVLVEAGLEPSLCPGSPDESLLQLRMLWPYGAGPPVDALLFNVTAPRHKYLRAHILRDIRAGAGAGVEPLRLPAGEPEGPSLDTYADSIVVTVGGE